MLYVVFLKGKNNCYIYSEYETVDYIAFKCNFKTITFFLSHNQRHKQLYLFHTSSNFQSVKTVRQ